MTYTFTLEIRNESTDQTVYSEYHNFREHNSGFTYYRGGSNDIIEIEVSKHYARQAMQSMIDNGWTCDKPKVLSIWI